MYRRVLRVQPLADGSIMCTVGSSSSSTRRGASGERRRAQSGAVQPGAAEEHAGGREEEAASTEVQSLTRADARALHRMCSAHSSLQSCSGGLTKRIIGRILANLILEKGRLTSQVRRGRRRCRAAEQGRPCRGDQEAQGAGQEVWPPRARLCCGGASIVSCLTASQCSCIQRTVRPT